LTLSKTATKVATTVNGAIVLSEKWNAGYSWEFIHSEILKTPQIKLFPRTPTDSTKSQNTKLGVVNLSVMRILMSTETVCILTTCQQVLYATTTTLPPHTPKEIVGGLDGV
jgi:hypothetical protein